MPQSFETLDLISLQKEFFVNLSDKGRSENTLKNYKTDLDCFNLYLDQYKKHLSITDFDIPQVREYGSYLDNRYSSDNSRRRRVQALRIFFDYLVEKGIFSQNPVRKLPTSPKFLDIPRPATPVHVKTLWTFLVEEGKTRSGLQALCIKRNQVITLLVYGAGLKVSDLSGLTRQNIIITKDQARVMVKPPKRDLYTVPLPSAFVKVYQDYIEALDEQQYAASINFDEILFNANPYRILSGGLSSRGLEVIFEDWRKKLLIELTPKTLRQACIFRWLQAKENDSTVKEWMGVAPSYSMKLYRDHMDKFIYSDNFIEEIYLNHRIVQ